MKYQYILSTITSVILLCFISIKIMFPFWAKQPVFHVYDLHYYFMSPKVIQENKTKHNKWINYNNIVPVYSLKENESYTTEMVELISQHYLRNKSLEYMPKKQHILPYINTKDVIIMHYYYADKMIGTITLRTLDMILSSKEITIQYVDYLCIAQEHRKKGIAQELIATLYDAQQRDTSYKVSLFKNEGKQRGIIPLTIYHSYRCNIKTVKVTPLYMPYKITVITDKQLHTLYEMFREIQRTFICYISMSVAQLVSLIVTKNITLYTLQYKDSVLALYFIKNTQCFHNNKEVKELYCSFKSNGCTKEMFIAGCRQIIGNIQKTDHEIIIEKIGHNAWLLESFKSNITSSYVTGYYLYNYIHKTVSPHDVYINV